MEPERGRIEKKCAPCLSEGIHCDLDLGEGMTCALHAEIKKCDPCLISGKDCDAKMQMPGIGEIACSDMMGTDPVQLHWQSSPHIIPHREDICFTQAAYRAKGQHGNCWREAKRKGNTRKCSWWDFKCHARNTAAIGKRTIEYGKCMKRKLDYEKTKCAYDGRSHGCHGKNPCRTSGPWRNE